MATGSSMKLTSMVEARVGKFTMDWMCMRSMSASRASRSVNSGMACMGVTISRKLLPSVLRPEKYSKPEPGSATTSNVGLGM